MPHVVLGDCKHSFQVSRHFELSPLTQVCPRNMFSDVATDSDYAIPLLALTENASVMLALLKFCYPVRISQVNLRQNLRYLIPIGRAANKYDIVRATDHFEAQFNCL